MQTLWQSPRQFVAGNADRFVDASEGVFGEYVVFGLAEDQTDGRLVQLMPKLVVNDVAVKIEFASVLGFEWAGLQLDDDEGPQPQVVEEQVNVEVVVADGEAVLPTDKREALAEFQQKFFEMANQFGFEFSLVKRFSEREEVEDVWVFESLLYEVGLRRGEELIEIADGFAGTPVGIGLDH